MDIEKQINYWREGAHASLRSVPTLADGEFWAEALFWTHLAVEKALKAHVVKVTNAVPPYIHALTRLAEIAQIALTPEQVRLCKDLNLYHRFARYPDESVSEPDRASAECLLSDAKEFLEWLLQKL